MITHVDPFIMKIHLQTMGDKIYISQQKPIKFSS